ncbi:nitrilase-related carbon-nitrogen hydrolase [Rothia sp. P7181]|uniref:nitrilase-related carbon-nitrogen hydrolase n=1 Tax=unclassified Rothia (in: high G+C Gram-positive bacteria) TaxID=2689056 RepID=UPI003AE5CF86
MKIALAQIRSTPNVFENLTIVRDYAEQAQQQGAQLVVFPEATMFPFGEDLYTQTHRHYHQWEQTLSEFAQDIGIHIIAGGFAPEPSEAHRVYNQLSCAFSLDKIDKTAESEKLQYYRKIHVYDALGYRESAHIIAGKEPVLITIDGVCLGLSTCYDVRFPELYQYLADAGAQCMVISASWAGGPHKREQWQTLTSARALDTGSYVIAVDQALSPTPNSGIPSGIGYSRAIAPYGEILCELGEVSALAIVDIDLTQVERTRESLPLLQQRQLKTVSTTV